ncbi:TIR domain-containing protein [Streptomyces sp. NPDC046909]|uniref:toll/interleukin-1 receptor domain-containing protein n=1 Tax=Streptomyces sp. NPDC046909 TaxID=3155617 RepID=UPI0033F7F2A4
MRYAAFISYSHSADAHRARVLHEALHRFARPWNKPRALRVFLDKVSLSADPGLWSTVEAALGDSEYLILLASPESARSPWVGREISWWRQGPRAKNLLLVVTGGELYWDHEAGDFDWDRTTCLPEALRGHFDEEPLWVDLSWVDEDHSGSLRDGRFQDCVADVAAHLHGRPKDDLTGEDVRQHRRLRRFRRGMFSAVCVLGVLAVVAAGIAVVQEGRAEDQARIATARQLAATALSLSDTDLDVAALLALQAYDVQETPETLSALYRLTTASPHLVRFLQADGTVTALAHTTAAKYLAVGTDTGSVTVWSSDGTRRVAHVPVEGRVTELTFSGDDRLLAVGTETGQAVVQDMADGSTRRLSGVGGEVRGLAFRPSSHELAVADDRDVLLYGDTGRAPGARVGTGSLAGVQDLAFYDKGRKLVAVTTQDWRLYDSRLRTLRSGHDTIYPANGYTPGESPSGNCLGIATFGGSDFVSLTDLLRGDLAEGSGCGAHPDLPGREASALAVSDDNRAVVGTSEGLFLATAPEGRPDDAVLETLPGVTAPSVLAFSPGAGDRLASADSATVALWDLDKTAPAAPTLHRHGVSVPNTTKLQRQLPLAVAPDGRVAWSQEPTGEDSLRVLSRGENIGSIGAPNPFDAVAFARKDRNTLYAAVDCTVGTWKSSDGGAMLREGLATLSAVAGPTRIATRPDGDVSVICDDGSLYMLDDERQFTQVVLTAPASPPQQAGAAVTALDDTGTLAAVAAGDGRVDVYEIPSGHRLRRLDLGSSAPVQLGLSEKTHSLLAVTDDGILERWDLRTGSLVQRSDGAGRYGLALDPSGRWAATLAGDGTMWLWDAVSGNRLGSTTLPLSYSLSGSGTGGTESGLAFSADGARLWTVTEGGELLSWDTSVAAWSEELCARAGRRLSDAERSRYLTSLSDDDTACADAP